MKRLISFALTLTLVVTMCFGSVGTAKAYAADFAALTVYDGDKMVKEYSLEDLQAIAKAEGDKLYKYSGYNRNPSFYVYGDPDNKDTPPRGKEAMKCIGPTVAGILADAGVTYTDDQLISFEAADGLVESFAAGDLFCERYYYPKGKFGTELGMAAPEEAYADAELTVPIIDLNDSENEESVLRFGQIAPNEQNVSAFVKYVADGGSIIVGDAPTEAWEGITSANYNSGVILPGTKLEFDLPKSIIGKKVAAYYTLDSSEPGHGDYIYNYDKYGGVHDLYMPDEEGSYTFTFKVIGYGKLDSKVTTFTYEVVDVDSPGTPSEVTAESSADGKQANISWAMGDDADGYEVLKHNVTTDKFEILAEVTECAYSDNAVAQNENYKYKVRAFKQLSSGQKVYSANSKELSVMVREEAVEPDTPTEPEEPVVKPQPPVVAKPALNSVTKTGYAGIQVKWSKVAKADGYQVWRYDAVSKKYELVKTITNKNTVSWKNTGLKTGRKYSYKVRAFANFEGNKVFSKYSGIKSAAPQLNKPVIAKLTPGKNSVTVKWKQVPGANGYKIYRATAKNGKYTCVKTITKGGTLSWKNTKLKKGKTYYYKVKAYRIVDKKNVYSNISLSKYTKSK